MGRRSIGTDAQYTAGIVLVAALGVFAVGYWVWKLIAG